MKHFLHFNDFSKQEMMHIFELADKLKSGSGECDLLKGKTIVLFFPESSIRTRISFEKGIKILGGNTILFPPEALDKKENIRDVIGYLENWADMVIARHKDLSLMEDMAGYSQIPIVNAMTSVNHPCEILADLYALSKNMRIFMKRTIYLWGQREISEIRGKRHQKCSDLSLRNAAPKDMK